MKLLDVHRHRERERPRRYVFSGSAEGNVAIEPPSNPRPLPPPGVSTAGWKTGRRFSLRLSTTYTLRCRMHSLLLGPTSNSTIPPHNDKPIDYFSSVECIP